MQCCQASAIKHGRHRNGTQRYRCTRCGKTFTEPRPRPLGNMTIGLQRASQAIRCLVEGCSVLSTSRLTGLNKNTVLKLLLLAGEKAERVMDTRVRNVDCQIVQADELWTYVHTRQERLRIGDPYEYGDQYIFVALDAYSKLVLAFAVGKRDADTTRRFIEDLRDRLAGRIQLSTDGFTPYITAVEDVFGDDVDYAQTKKSFGNGRVTGLRRKNLQGRPDPDLITTAHVERQNLTIRMSMRRLTRLTNAFSKRLRNLRAAAALHFAHYNFCRIHGTLEATPAMEAEITDHVWTVEELLGG